MQLGEEATDREVVGILRARVPPELAAQVLTGIPLVYQLHVLSTLALFAIWPFGRLVHAWSVPVAYIARRPILYRRRAPLPSPRRVALELATPPASSRPTTGASDSHAHR